VKYSLFIACAFFSATSFCLSETRLGNYFFGFGINGIEHSRSYWEKDNNGTTWTPQERNMEGFSFEMSLNIPLSDSFDLNLGVSRSDFSDDNVSDHLNQANADLIFRYNRIMRESGFLLPFVGIGVQYSSYKIGNWNSDQKFNSVHISNKEKFHLKVQTGAELYLNDEITLTPSMSYVNRLFLDAHNDFIFDVSLTWLATRRNALSLAFSKYVDSKASSIGLEYLHSWK